MRRPAAFSDLASVSLTILSKQSTSAVKSWMTGKRFANALTLKKKFLSRKNATASLGAHYVEADAPLREVGDLLFCRDEWALLHDRSSKTKNAAVGTGTRSR